MKKIFVTGANGSLGSALVKQGCSPFLSNVLNFDDVQREIKDVSPDVIIHCAGLSVDGSTENFEKADKIAVQGTANVIDNDLYPHIQTIFISSSHVFDGKKGNYREKDKPNPVNDYGILKLGAEQVARISGGKIIRLSTCFTSEHKDIKYWKYMAEQNLGFEVPTFIRRTYAHIDHIAQGIMDFANRWEFMPDLMHISGTEDLSMYEFALTCASHYEWDRDLIIPRKKEVDLVGQVKRPHKAGLNTGLAKKYGIPLFSVYEGMKIL